jgi:Ca-activated chloride channel family protein
MTLTWPLALVVAPAAPALLALYVVRDRRRRKQAVSYSSVALLRAALPRQPAWRRHVPMGLLVASLGMLGVASARPQMNRDVPVERTSVILALDVSRSMCSGDVEPNRLAVAQEAAQAFVQDQPAGTRTGLVVFSGSAQIAVPPTKDKKVLVEAIAGLTTSMGTAIGTAMLKSLDAIAEVNPAVTPVGDVAETSADAEALAPDAAPPGGDFVPDIVVLLTDGANTRGIEPLEAVPFAVERRVRVFTIGFGTTEPSSMSCSVAQLGGAGRSGGFRRPGEPGGGGRGGGGGGGGGGRSPLVADLPTLEKVAEQTGGVAYTAADAAQLTKVFADLPKDVTTQEERREVTSLLVGLGTLLAAAAVLASFRWRAYP